MTSNKKFKKQARKRASKTGSYQAAQQQMVLAAKRRDEEANAVIVEQLRSDGVVVHARIDRFTAQLFATSELIQLLVSVEPCPPDVMPRLRLIPDGLTGTSSNDPALTNGEWRRITSDEVHQLFGPPHNPNDQLSWFVGGRFVRQFRWRDLSPNRWTPPKPRSHGRNGDE